MLTKLEEIKQALDEARKYQRIAIDELDLCLRFDWRTQTEYDLMRGAHLHANDSLTYILTLLGLLRRSENENDIS